MSDTLKAQADSYRHGIKVLDGTIEQLEGQVKVAIADRHNMRKELEAIEKFLREQEVRS